MGGIVGFIILFFKMCLYPYAKLKMYERLVGNAFDFKSIIVKKGWDSEMKSPGLFHKESVKKSDSSSSSSSSSEDN